MATTIMSENSRPTTSLKKVKPTRKELESIGEALKSAEFRSMLADYAKEINDPANKTKQMREMYEMEAAKGVHCTFLTPVPGYVIKTRVLAGTGKHANTDDDELVGFGKVFVNVCSNENIGKPELKKAAGSVGAHWSIPYSTSKPRRDVDKAGANCTVYDVLFHPESVAMADRNQAFRRMINSTALEGIENAFKLQLDRKRLRFPKLKFKGSFHTTVLRRPLQAGDKFVLADDAFSENVKETTTTTTTGDINSNNKNSDQMSEPTKVEQETEEDEEEEDDKFATPKHVMRYRYTQRDVPTGKETDPCRPTEIVVEVSLPEMSSAKGLDLDVLEHMLTLTSELPVAYKLVLRFPYPVYEEKGQAKFDKANHSLVVTLPVKESMTPMKEPVSRLISTDSGIDLDFDVKEEKASVTTSAPQTAILPPPTSDGSLLTLPPYNCNIYENLMVFTIGVQNVVADSLEKELLPSARGYQLKFHTLGQGFVPFHYGFCLSFDFKADEGNCTMDDLEVEIWDNNMIFQLSTPKGDTCSSYRVGTTLDDLSEPMSFPQLSVVKEKCYKLKGQVKSPEPALPLDSDDDDSSNKSEDSKERHSSGESQDSAIFFSSTSTSSPASLLDDPAIVRHGSPTKRFTVTPATIPKTLKDGVLSSIQKAADLKQTTCDGVRGILKRPRCYSESHSDFLKMMSSVDSSSTIHEEEEEDEVSAGGRSRNDSSGSKKSVRFNEIVQRQVYRQNSSILGQKTKNQKKAEQKRRKAAARRASEGDVASMMAAASVSSCDEEYHNNHDSGLASSMDEADMDHKKANDKRNNNNSKKKPVSRSAAAAAAAAPKKKVSEMLEESNSDLIFDLDF